jgi:hypothetical protein
VGRAKAAWTAKKPGFSKQEAGIRTTTPLAAFAKGGFMRVHQLRESYRSTVRSGASRPLWLVGCRLELLMDKSELVRVQHSPQVLDLVVSYVE